MVSTETENHVVLVEVYENDEALESHWISEHMAKYLEQVDRSEEHTSELQSRTNLVCRLLLEKKKNSSHALIS